MKVSTISERFLQKLNILCLNCCFIKNYFHYISLIASLNNLYNTLLQREYAGPVVFPNQRVVRKAQRSPSLRLRFGRRADPEIDQMPQTAEKRWFGDVNQKPIRSPSLRLRFGRRSDPSMPIHSAYDIMMNEQQLAETNDNDYNDAYDGYYERVVRKPQRLRFGRSLPFQAFNSVNENQLSNDIMDNEEDFDLANNEDDFYNTLMHSQKVRNLLMSLQKNNDEDMHAVHTPLDEEGDEFERGIRKPGPLRLRWGRSTGGRSSQVNSEDKNINELDQKVKLF